MQPHELIRRAARRPGGVSRRVALRGLGGGGLGALAPLGGRRAAAQGELLVASGAGVTLAQMPSPGGSGTVSLRQVFAFDAHYAQCAVEDNPERFALDTYAMGRLVVEPHTFFMAMYATDVSLVGIYDAGGGQRVAKLSGALAVTTAAATATASYGSRSSSEYAFYDIVAVDGGRGGGAAGDSFAFTVSFDPTQAPLNHRLFGPKPTFPGQMVAGEVTIAPAVALPLLPALPGIPVPPGTPAA